LTDVIDHTVRQGAEADVLMQCADDVPYVGSHVSVGGEKLLNFGGCSYLGLELRPELVEGAIRALRQFGTQFSFSRAFLESPLYEELERTLEQLTGGHVLATPSTSLGHIAALPALIGEQDAVIIDRATHASVHTAVLLLKGVQVVCVDHNDMAQLEQTIETLQGAHRRVWYLFDGLYSMHGDLAPFAAIAKLYEKYPSLHLYCDDAHATSWSGVHGRGCALEHFSDRSRLFVALSLNKAFSAAGGALVFPEAASRDRVRRTGGPMLFSGPIQPPMLGVALASAKLHLGAEHAELQRELLERIRLTNTLAAGLGIELASVDDTPIFFVRCGQLERCFELVRALRSRGFFTCPGMFPAVSRDHSGVRFTVSLHNSHSDIVLLINTIAEEMAELGNRGARPSQVQRKAG
jgi:7-keto-8-aminopelargonate synthetase-like enzyme